MRKNRIVSMFVGFSLLLSLAGCGESQNYSLYNYTIDEGENYWTMAYESFDGNMRRELEVTGSSEHAFTIETVTESGVIDVEMKGIDGIRYYEGEDLGTDTITIMTDGPGRFVFEVTAENHSGSFSIVGE